MTIGTATRATRLPDRVSATEQRSIALPDPVRYAAPTVSRVGTRRSGAAAEGSQGAAIETDGEVKTNEAAAPLEDASVADGGNDAAVQLTSPAKSTEGHLLSHGSSLTSGETSETRSPSTPGSGATLPGVLNSRANGARDVLGVGDCVSEGVSDWLGVEVELLVLDDVCDCDGDAVTLAVREMLCVTDGVDVMDCEGDPERLAVHD